MGGGGSWLWWGRLRLVWECSVDCFQPTDWLTNRLINRLTNRQVHRGVPVQQGRVTAEPPQELLTPLTPRRDPPTPLNRAALANRVSLSCKKPALSAPSRLAPAWPAGRQALSCASLLFFSNRAFSSLPPHISYIPRAHAHARTRAHNIHTTHTPTHTPFAAAWPDPTRTGVAAASEPHLCVCAPSDGSPAGLHTPPNPRTCTVSPKQTARVRFTRARKPAPTYARTPPCGRPSGAVLH